MNREFLVPLPEGTSFETAKEQAHSLAKHAKCDVRLTLAFVVSSQYVADILTGLFGGNGSDKQAEKKVSKAAKQEGEMGPRSWRELDSVDVISARELKDSLKQNDRSLLNRRFVNSKGEKFVVMDMDGALTLIKEPAA